MTTLWCKRPFLPTILPYRPDLLAVYVPWRFRTTTAKRVATTLQGDDEDIIIIGLD
jgi:hypothetical protein